MRGVAVTGSLNISQICQPIASPSRSSSVAIITPPGHSAISARMRCICFIFSVIDTKLSLKLFLTSIDFNPSNSRKCPYVAIQRYPGPRYDSILEHFAGDSTRTNVVCFFADIFGARDVIWYRLECLCIYKYNINYFQF